MVDMHHGIIQESEWTGPGTYLNKIIQEKELYNNRGMGRIYQVVHEDFKPDKKRPNMLNESASELVEHLDHPNGWWRDNAQLLLVIRNDKSVVPALKKRASGENTFLRKKPNPITRIHALWTLEGMDEMEKDILLQALSDPEPQIRKTAVWISEMYIRQKDPQLLEKLQAMLEDISADVRVQLALLVRTSNSDRSQAILKELLAAKPGNELIRASYKSHIETHRRIAAEQERVKNLSPAERELIAQGAAIYKQLCANCHGAGGKGIQMAGSRMPAPPLAGSPRMRGKDVILPIEIMLHGLKGPIDGVEYTDMMPSMAGQSDVWIAAVLSYVRNSSDLGNKASVNTPEEVKEVRARTKLTPGGETLHKLEVHKGYRTTEQNWVKD